MKITFNTILNILLVLVAGLFIGKHFYMKPRFINGESTPDFTATTLSGENLQLSALKGQYILLDFWGSWCGPCRAEAPVLKQLYARYNGARFEDASGFQIVSIGIEDNEARWRRAIEQDGLEWPYHVLDLASSLRFFNSPVATSFGIKQVPTKYLLNPKGQIIAVNPSAREIARLLEEKLE
ncbi:MAG: TlpA family protein disulfide reductase [Phaeodactylibacter sp.]|nr:TlpA family protein disulfide reductase [Phaeodactylibacter sp.]MCB9275754.1 TlpA family protein disulfide reductase [Lewinellaceae bacterium]